MSAPTPGHGDGSGGRFRLEPADPFGGPPRLVAHPVDPLGLATALAREIAPPYQLLYVLLRSRTLRPEGRYQARESLSPAELAAFLARFGPFLGGDGRHGLWIVSATEPAAVTLDRRGTVEVLGPSERLAPVALGLGLAPGLELETPPAPPRPIDEANDPHELALIGSSAWTWFPLEPSDEFIE